MSTGLFEFIAQTGRMHIKHLITTHFSAPNVVIEQSDVLIKDDGKLERMLNPKPVNKDRHDALEQEIARHKNATPQVSAEQSVHDDQYVELTAEIMSLGKPAKSIPSRVITVPPRPPKAEVVKVVTKKTIAKKASLNAKRRR